MSNLSPGGTSLSVTPDEERVGGCLKHSNIESEKDDVVTLRVGVDLREILSAFFAPLREIPLRGNGDNIVLLGLILLVGSNHRLLRSSVVIDDDVPPALRLPRPLSSVRSEV